jgi:hypothetical protein
MPDEYGASQSKFVSDLDYVIRVGGEAGVLLRIIGAEVGPARTYVVEEDNAELVLERRSHVPPHILITAESVREHHRRGTSAADLDVVANDGGHFPSNPSQTFEVSLHGTNMGSRGLNGIK